MVEIQGENGATLTAKQFTDGETAATLEKVGVINNLGHSLWEQIVLLVVLKGEIFQRAFHF